MKQLSFSERNHMSKEEMAAMIIRMQQSQLQLQQQMNIFNEVEDAAGRGVQPGGIPACR